MQRPPRIESPVLAVHAAAVAGLAPHHDDPFDRLLLARVITEPLKVPLCACGTLQQAMGTHGMVLHADEVIYGHGVRLASRR